MLHVRRAVRHRSGANMSETITSISEAVRIVETFIQDMADDKLDTGDKEKLAEAEKQFAKLEHAMRIIKNRL